MRVLAASLLAAVAIASTASAQTTASPPPPPRPAPQLDKACPAGSSVVMDLSAGKYVIKASPEPRLRVWWTTREPDQARDVSAKADVSGSSVRLSVSGPSNGFEVTIELPARSTIAISGSAGQFIVDPFDGDVDISAWAGEFLVGVGSPSNYSSVYASVTAGEIAASAFQTQKGGLLRSFSWEGKGKHFIRIRVTAGRIELHSQDAAEASS